jgi:hypothetical protein
VTAQALATRLLVREYLPLAGWLLGWFMLGLAIGHADAVRLLAATFLVQAVRIVATLDTYPALARRARTDGALFKASRRTALRLDLGGLTAALALSAVMALLLSWRGMGEGAAMVAIAAAGLPARNPCALLVAHRDRVGPWRIGGAFVILAGSAAVLLLDLGWIGAAIVLALRDWGGLLTTALLGRVRPAPDVGPTTVLSFAEAAGQTEAGARRKLSYRLLKTVSTMLLGPFGNLAARTGRSAGKLDSRLARIVPRHKGGYVVFTATTASACAFLLSISTEPALFLAAAGLARLAASGAVALLWWRYSGAGLEEDDDDD